MPLAPESYHLLHMAIQLTLVGSDSDVTRVAAEGEVLAADARRTNALQGLLGSDWPRKRILLDFSKVTLMDSAAIGWLIASAKKLKESGGGLVIYAVQPRVRNMLDLLAVGRMIPIVADETDARSKALAGG